MQNWRKRIVAAGLAAQMAVGLLSGCGSTESVQDGAKEKKAEVNQTVSEKEKPETGMSEHPQFIPDGVRKIVLVENGEEIFNLSKEPADYKMEFDYWEILNPYDETVTVNTEVMYELFEVLSKFDFQTPVSVEEGIDTGIETSDTTITLEFVDTLDSSKAKQTEYADKKATIVLGNEDGEGNRFAAIQGYEDQIYKLSASTIQSVYSLEPFNYILKIPVLVSIDTVESLEIKDEDKTYEMSINPEDEVYKFGNKKVEKEEFSALYQEISGVMLDSEADKEKVEEKSAPELEIIFHRNNSEYPEIRVVYYAYDDDYNLVEVNGNSYFLVKAEDVKNLKESIKKAF